MKTRDKIIEASLKLFNEKGERAITTNHIAYVRDSFVPVSSDTPAEVYLHQAYLQAHDVLVARAHESVLNLRRDGFIVIDDDQIDELIELMCVVGGFWVSYLMANSVSKSITKADVNRGVVKFIVLLWPHSTDKGKEVLTKLKLKSKTVG
jgi:hypothetical protein